MGLVVFIPIGPPTTCLTLSLRNLGFCPFNTNLLTIPSPVASCFTLIGLTWLSEYVSERSLIASLLDIWVLPCLNALRVWSGTKQNAWGTFALITVLLSYPYCDAILVAWASHNSGSGRTRSVSAAAYDMMVQLGNIVAANIYRSNDAPVYRTGNTVLIVIDVVSILMFPATKLYYIWRNKRRERVWNGMSEEERRQHLENLGDSGSKRLDFRFVH